MPDYIVINDDLRTMTIPDSIKILGVESDDDVNKIPFQMPKEYCGFDLSQFSVRVNYMNANGDGDMYIADDVEDLYIWFVVNIPYFVMWAIGIGIVIALIVARKKRKAKKNKQVE